MEGVLGAVVGRDCRPRWYHVELPVCPNGYVRAADVAVGTVRARIVVDLARRLVTFYRAGRAVLRERAG